MGDDRRLRMKVLRICDDMIPHLLTVPKVTSDIPSDMECIGAVVEPNGVVAYRVTSREWPVVENYAPLEAFQPVFAALPKEE